MINTSINAYMQNGGIQKSNLQNQNTNKESNIDKPSISDEIKLEISDESNALMKIDSLQKQLEDIFGTKKVLTSDELKKESELKAQIKELEVNSELPYSQDDKDIINKINIEIQKLLEKDYHSVQDDEQMFSLTKQLDEIGKKYEDSTLSTSDNTKKENLIKELRTLQGLKNPDAYELIEADKINKKIDIVKLEYQVSQLDKNSDSYISDKQALSEKISANFESLSKLDNEKERYKSEEVRETAKKSIQTSLSNIDSIKDNFYNSKTSSNSYDNLFSLNKTTTNSLDSSEPAEEKETNKWLNFLQDSRKDLYSSNISENEKIQNLMQRVSVLHE
ncbi:hypothetical protein ACH5BK_03680 [Arcobacter sp. YIC-80]|uniref:hypothetical protein n=1 Tax=Arcobacter sp. YIC-80 TaxID=3376683 RepID=UPI00384E5556